MAKTLQAIQKQAADKRREYVLDKLASIIPNAVNDRNAKIKQRKQAVQVKVASIVERVTNPEQRKQTVKTKVAEIVKKASGECCKGKTMPIKGKDTAKEQTMPNKTKEAPAWKSVPLPKKTDKQAPAKDQALQKFPLPKKN